MCRILCHLNTYRTIQLGVLTYNELMKSIFVHMSYLELHGTAQVA